MAYYSFVKKILLFEIALMNMDCIILNEINPIQKRTTAWSHLHMQPELSNS